MKYLVALAILAAAPAFAATGTDPEWPCIQRKQPHLSLGQVWTGPVPDDRVTELARDPQIDALAARLEQRRLPMEEAEAAIADFAADADDARLTALMVAVMGKIEPDRSALIEGIAYGVRHILETYDDAGANPESVTAVGGGTHNPVWLQAVSDITGRAQAVRHNSFGASYGNAFLAAVGVGDADAGDIDTWNPVAREIQPDASLSSLYDAGSGTYRQLYARTRELMRAG